MKYRLGQFFAVVILVGDAPPQEESALRRVEFATKVVHNLFGSDAAHAIGFVELGEVFLRSAKGGDGGLHHGAEHARIDVRLHTQHPVNVFLPAHHDTLSPACHRVALRHRVEFQANILRSLDLHDRQRLVVEDERIRIVVDDDDAVTTSEIDDARQEFERCAMTGWHMGIIDPHHLHIVYAWSILKGGEVRLPIVFVFEIIFDDFCTDQFAYRRIGRITRIGDEHLIARIEQRHRDVHDAFL